LMKPVPWKSPNWASPRWFWPCEPPAHHGGRGKPYTSIGWFIDGKIHGLQTQLHGWFCGKPWLG
jgi:hypothetical protein